MTNPTRVLEILRILADCPWGWEREGVGHGEIVELAGRHFIHEPGFEGLWEPTYVGRQILDGKRAIGENGYTYEV